MRLSITCLFLLLHIASVAQFKEIAKGKPFQEPEKGMARLLQMKNGYTALLFAENKSGLELKVYNEKHSLAFSKKLRPKLKVDYMNLTAMFETKGQIVFLISNLEARIPFLHRLVVDTRTGDIVQEERIGELRSAFVGFGAVTAFGRSMSQNFYALKDPGSDRYAVAFDNSSEKEPEKRLVLVIYNGDHQEVARARYEPEADDYAHINFVDMTFAGNTLHCLGYAHKVRAQGGPNENTNFIASLSVGDKTMRVKMLECTKNKELRLGMIRYNTVSDRLLMLSFEKDKKIMREGRTWLFQLDAKEVSLKAETEVIANDIQAKATELFGRREKFTGMPVNMFVYNDGSFTIALEEFDMEVYHPSQGRTVISNTIIEKIGFMHYDSYGKLVKSWYLPKEHFYWGEHPRSFYHHHIEADGLKLDKGDQFKSFVMIRVKGKEIVLLNDLEENEERIKDGKLTRIKGLRECEAFYFTLDTDIVPARKFLFGKGDGAKDRRMMLAPVSAYDEERNIFVTLRLDIHKAKQMYLVWIEP